MEVGDIAEATLMAIATAPDKRAALDLLQKLCRLHIRFLIGDPNIILFVFSCQEKPPFFV